VASSPPDECLGTGQEGRLDFENAVGDEWHVICRVCGATWVGGSSIVAPHEDVRTRRIG
jgi:hypothetical protein